MKKEHRKGQRTLGEKIIWVILSIVILFLAVMVLTVKPPQTSGPAGICISNLRVIDGAKQQYAHENNKPTNSIIGWDDILPYMKSKPDCPLDGAYLLNRIGTLPACNVRGHAIPSD